MIDSAGDLQPDTRWRATRWAWTAEETLVDHVAKPRLCVAALLPFAEGKPDWRGFETSLRWMKQCAAHYGVDLVFVLNADTVYLFDLDLSLYRQVLERFRACLPEARMIVGVTATGESREVVDAYLPHLAIVQEFDNVEAMLMT